MARYVDEDIDEEVLHDLGFDLNDEGATFDDEDFTKMGINPFKGTRARPGSEEKVLMLSARYAAGLPLWHDEDCYDHGPHERELMGAVEELPPQLVFPAEAEDD